MNELAKIRRRLGLSQRALAQKSGLSQSTIYELENNRRTANPSTLSKLARALEVDVLDLAKKEEKVMVEVGSLDEDGVYRGEHLRFTGELVDSFERGDMRVELYRCADGGYRVYIDDGSKPERTLYPFQPNPYTGELDYGLFSAEEVAERWPEFGVSLSVLRVRDID